MRSQVLLSKRSNDSAARIAAANCAESGNRSPENISLLGLSFQKTDFTIIKQFLTQCYKLFTILRTYMIRFHVLLEETQFQTMQVKRL